jgi:hypothetical protein
MPGPILHASVWDPKKGEHFVLVYRDAAKIAWGKRVHIERFITNKTYSLAKEGAIGIDFLSEKKNPGVLRLRMVPAKRQKVKAVTVDLGKVPACGLTARGLKLSQKAVQSVELVPEPERPVKPARPTAQAESRGLLSKASRVAPQISPRTPPSRKKTRWTSARGSRRDEGK